MATLLIGPTGRYPDYARGENQYARVNGAQTAEIVRNGGGYVHGVTVGVAGTLLKLYDQTTSSGTLDDTTEIATLDLTGVEAGSFVLLDVDFSKGLIAVVTGAADLTIYFRGTQTVNPRTFGTQLDGGDSRTTGTSTDKGMAN